MGRTVACATSKSFVTGKVLALCGVGALFLFTATTCSAQFPHKKKKVDKSTSADNNAQPDKILYDRAVDDIKRGRQEVGRLNMQTLINTYPDSEYLAKAKLAIADSYYKEGGTSNLALAVSGYKDFIVFFPFLPEATYAQMQVAMTHFKQMDKPDRDRSHALAAEDEFQVFLQKYPNDPLAPQAEQHLREVQEVLAEGEYRIGYYYYVKGDKRAAAARLLMVSNRYPLYSKSDQALWMMGEIFATSEHKEVAALYYARIVKNYPLSALAPQAKDKLKAAGVPVPQADPAALAWMTAEQNTPRPRVPIYKKPLDLIKSGPTGEFQVAATHGTPNMQPESDSMSSAGDILKPGAKPTTGAGAPGTAIVQTVVTGGTPGATAESVGGQENTAPAANDGTATAPGTSEAPKEAGTELTPAVVAPAQPATAASDDAAKNPPPAAGTAETPGKSEAAPAAADAKSDSTAASTAPGTDAAKTGDAPSSDDSKKESSSKKKKGLRKLVPW